MKDLKQWSIDANTQIYRKLDQQNQLSKTQYDNIKQYHDDKCDGIMSILTTIINQRNGHENQSSVQETETKQKYVQEDESPSSKHETKLRRVGSPMKTQENQASASQESKVEES
jgi:hypothetical protein